MLQQINFIYVTPVPEPLFLLSDDVNKLDVRVYPRRMRRVTCISIAIGLVVTSFFLGRYSLWINQGSEAAII